MSLSIYIAVDIFNHIIDNIILLGLLASTKPKVGGGGKQLLMYVKVELRYVKNCDMWSKFLKVFIV